MPDFPPAPADKKVESGQRHGPSRQERPQSRRRHSSTGRSRPWHEWTS